MPAPDHAAPAANAQTDGADQEKLATLRAEFPGHHVSTETIVDRVRYVVRSRYEGVLPHTVITRDFAELRAALEAGRCAAQ
jgi:hypothetical protein